MDYQAIAPDLTLVSSKIHLIDEGFNSMSNITYLSDVFDTIAYRDWFVYGWQSFRTFKNKYFLEFHMLLISSKWAK